MFLQEAPKAKNFLKRGLLFPKTKAGKAHFTLSIEKLIPCSFPSFYGRTVLSFFPIPSPPRGARPSPSPAAPGPSPAAVAASPRLLPRPDLHRATISGTAAARDRWGAISLSGDGRAELHGRGSSSVGVSSPERRRQGRAPRPQLRAGGGELPLGGAARFSGLSGRGPNRRGQGPRLAV